MALIAVVNACLIYQLVRYVKSHKKVEALASLPSHYIPHLIVSSIQIMAHL